MKSVKRLKEKFERQAKDRERRKRRFENSLVQSKRQNYAYRYIDGVYDRQVLDNLDLSDLRDPVEDSFEVDELIPSADSADDGTRMISRSSPSSADKALSVLRSNFAQQKLLLSRSNSSQTSSSGNQSHASFNSHVSWKSANNLRPNVSEGALRNTYIPQRNPVYKEKKKRIKNAYRKLEEIGGNERKFLKSKKSVFRKKDSDFNNIETMSIYSPTSEIHDMDWYKREYKRNENRLHKKNSPRYLESSLESNMFAPNHLVMETFQSLQYWKEKLLKNNNSFSSSDDSLNNNTDFDDLARRLCQNFYIENITPSTTSPLDSYREPRKKIQDQLLEGILKYAESKYGKKRPVKAGDKQSAKEDYELYLSSVKAKVKTASDKLNTILKQKKDIDAKAAQAEKEHGLQQGKFTKAEEEKQSAINEGRDPVLPKDFIVPQRAKKANAGLGAMVMKASASMWEDKFSQMRSKKTAGGNTPEWMAKQKKSDKTTALLKVGQQKKASKKDGDAPSFGASKLKSSESAARRRKEEEEKPNPFKVSLKKTGKLEEEEAKTKPAPKKADPPPGAAEEERPRRRGRPRNDSE